MSSKRSFKLFEKKPVGSKIIIRFLFLIITLNKLIFNQLHYLQKMECRLETVQTIHLMENWKRPTFDYITVICEV